MASNCRDTAVSKLERQKKDKVLLVAVFIILASPSKVVVLLMVNTCQRRRLRTSEQQEPVFAHIAVGGAVRNHHDRSVTHIQSGEAEKRRTRVRN